MPPLELMVLSAVDGYDETVETMRSHDEVAPYGLALVDEDDVACALGVLLDQGLVEAHGDGRVVVPAPNRDPASLRRYWFNPTEQGRQVLREGEDLLDAYWTAHPII